MREAIQDDKFPSDLIRSRVQAFAVRSSNISARIPHPSFASPSGLAKSTFPPGEGIGAAAPDGCSRRDVGDAVPYEYKNPPFHEETGDFINLSEFHTPSGS